MNLNKKMPTLLGLLSISLALTSCTKKDDNTTTNTNNPSGETTGGSTSSEVKREYVVKEREVKFSNNDNDIYENNLGEFLDLLDAAEDPKVTNIDERYVRMAKAEAALLDSAVMIPIYTQGGNFALTRVAPRTVAYTYSGNDDDKLKNLVATAGSDASSIIKRTEREELLKLWDTAINGGAAYDPKTYLEGKGYTIATTYTSSFSTAPETLDILNTSAHADSESLVNVVEGLVEYNNLGALVPTSGTAWTVSDDGKTYTFTVPSNNPWVDNEGNVLSAYGNVNAQDYVDGFHHMLDSKAGLEELISQTIVGVADYLDKKNTDFSSVGFKASDDNTKVIITLTNPEAFFPTRLAYSMFSPLDSDFFASRGGVFGIDALASAKSGESYTYGKVNSPSDMIYCGAFYISNHTAAEAGGEIRLARNTNYHKNSSTTLDELLWIYDAGDNPENTWNSFINGTYTGLGLSSANGNLDRAANAGLYNKDKPFESTHAYVADTTATSYFGGLNLHRQTFSLSSGDCSSFKNTSQREFWQKAIQSTNIRKAILCGFDKGNYNGTSVGEQLKYFNLRNMYTKPDFVILSSDVTLDGRTFKKGSTYGEVCQYYCDVRGVGITIDDGKDGWYNLDAAKKYLEQGKKDLAKAGVEWDDSATIEWVYYSGSPANTATANAFAKKFNEDFKDLGLQVKLIEAKTMANYYAVGYRASNGAATGMDLFAGSGWGPDYADPSTYLDTFLPEGEGYMTKVIGLY